MICDPNYIRQSLVDRVRREIEQGKYVTPERIALAVEALMDDLDDMEDAA